jgi:hypothetical protein
LTGLLKCLNSGDLNMSNSQSTLQSRPVSWARAIYDWKPEESDNSCIEIKKDQVLEIYARQPNGWWDAVLRDERQRFDKRGWIPSNHVVSIEWPENNVL